MKFVVIQEVNGKEVANVVEAESPIEAIHTLTFNVFFHGESKGKDVATIGVYDIGNYNHLIAIDDKAQFASWAQGRIDELKDKLKEFDD